MKGRIDLIHIKRETPGERGLPKSPVASVVITPQGVSGDFNRWRHEKDSDNPDQAVLLMTVEMIAELNRDGWPVKPGDIGENFTIAGMNYQDFQIGKAFALGSEARVEISKPCDPCNVLHQLPYVGPDRGPEFLKAIHGRRGWFARVTRPGEVRVGDDVILLR